VSTFALITAVAQATAPVAAEPLYNAVELSIPSLDGARGFEAGYERWIPRYRISLTGTGELRESATGDYGGLRAGAGVELRYYWRASAWRSAQPAGSMVGWFVGDRIEVSVDALHDREAGRWLDSTVELGNTTLVGYRIAPWRGLAITPSLGAGWRHDFVAGADWNRPTLSAGLTAGWMF
jgi:hypothetical protein